MAAAVREPYVGLRPFGVADRGRFFGRTTECLAVLEYWSTHRLTVLHGPPGAGKTSLLQAAVIPLVSLVDGRPGVVLPVGSTTPSGAAAASTAAGNPLSLALLNSWSQPPSRAEEPTGSIVSFLRGLRPEMQPTDVPPIFAVVDQFERVFLASGHRQYRQEFLGQLIEAIRRVPRLHLLISTRDEFLAELGWLESEIGEHGRYRLGPLVPEAALEAVVGPLRGTGQSFAPGAAEEVVDNLRAEAPGESRDAAVDTVEPAQLQAVCSALWRALPDVEVITTEDLYGPADLDSGMVQFCEAAVREVASAQDMPELELMAWLARTFVTDQGTRNTAYEGASGVAGMPAAVAEQLVDQYVLTAECRLGARWYQLPHDRLVAPVRETFNRWVGESTGPVNPAASLAAAEGALAAGQLVLAARRATEAVRTSGTRDTHTKATALSCLGQVAVRGGHDQQAASHFRAAAELFEFMQDQAGVGRLLGELGRILMRSGRYADAIAELQCAEARRPSDLGIQLDLARALRNCGQLWAATAVLNTTLTIEPGTVEALVERGLIRVETGELPYALDDLNNAIRLTPAVGQRAEVRSALAHAQARLGRTA